MGQVIIDVPQNINFRTTIESVEVADEILEIIEKRKKTETKKTKISKPKKILQTVSLILPYDDLDEIDENEAVGIWADREESADEIARRIRENNRKIT